MMPAESGPIWLVTFATYQRRAVFANPVLFDACVVALRETSERNGYGAYALAVMPDHLHLVVDAGTTGHAASKVVTNLKGVVSRRVFQASPELRPDLRSNHLWRREYQAKVLPDRISVERACDYVRQNPRQFGGAASA